jgi:hypothetical protein
MDANVCVFECVKDVARVSYMSEMSECRKCRTVGCGRLTLLSDSSDISDSQGSDLASTPPDLTWCSVLPRQTAVYSTIHEYAFPPGTHLQPVAAVGQPFDAEKVVGPRVERR